MDSKYSISKNSPWTQLPPPFNLEVYVLTACRSQLVWIPTHQWQMKTLQQSYQLIYSMYVHTSYNNIIMSWPNSNQHYTVTLSTLNLWSVWRCSLIHGWKSSLNCVTPSSHAWINLKRRCGESNNPSLFLLFTAFLMSLPHNATETPKKVC